VELSGLRSRGCAVHSYGVCDDEAYFLQEVDTLLTQLGHTGPGVCVAVCAGEYKGVLAPNKPAQEHADM
jgi:hypothetical protein